MRRRGEEEDRWPEVMMLREDERKTRKTKTVPSVPTLDTLDKPSTIVNNTRRSFLRPLRCINTWRWRAHGGSTVRSRVLMQTCGWRMHASAIPATTSTLCGSRRRTRFDALSRPSPSTSTPSLPFSLCSPSAPPPRSHMCSRAWRMHRGASSTL